MYLPLGSLYGKGTHAVTLGPIKALVRCVGNLQITAPVGDVSIHKPLVRQPTLPLGFGIRGGAPALMRNRRCRGPQAQTRLRQERAQLQSLRWQQKRAWTFAQVALQEICPWPTGNRPAKERPPLKGTDT